MSTHPQLLCLAVLISVVVFNSTRCNKDNIVESDAGTDVASDAGTDAGSYDSFAAGPITPPSADCEDDAYIEGDCTHPCVEESCEGGWCRVPEGCFIYGSPVDEWFHGADTEVETPLTLAHDFVIQQHEVTRAEWAYLGFPFYDGEPSPSGFAFCTEEGCPVTWVSWWEAVAAANRLSELHDLQPCYELTGCVGAVGEGMICEEALALHANVYDCPGYRVPTMAEWEYAIKAGTRTSFYSGDITINDGYSFDANLDPIAWYWWNSGPGGDWTSDIPCEGKTTHVVEQKEPNGWHLHDMSGNVMEWTWDQFSGGGFHGTPQTDPLDDGDSGRHAYRGGSAGSDSILCRSAKHFELPVDYFSIDGGFRLVRSVSWPEGADTETDEDTDIDTDTEPVDTDVDHDPADCPLNSGWPCTCDVPLEESGFPGSCEDGSACAFVDPHHADWSSDFGICSSMCTSASNCDATAFTAEPSCELDGLYSTADGPDGCVLWCSDDLECPSDQQCIIHAFYGPDATEGFCYPYP